MSIDVDVLSQLMPNILTVITQLCATAILFFLMYKLAWKPVKEIMDKRSEYEQSKLTEAENIKAESERLNEEAKSNVDEAKEKSRVIIEDAKKNAELQKEQILKEADDEVRNKLAKADETIAKDRQNMEKDLQKEMVEIAMAASEKFMSTKNLSKADRKSIDSFVKEISDERDS